MLTYLVALVFISFAVLTITLISSPSNYHLRPFYYRDEVIVGRFYYDKVYNNYHFVFGWNGDNPCPLSYRVNGDTGSVIEGVSIAGRGKYVPISEREYWQGVNSAIRKNLSRQVECLTKIKEENKV